MPSYTFQLIITVADDHIVFDGETAKKYASTTAAPLGATAGAVYYTTNLERADDVRCVAVIVSRWEQPFRAPQVGLGANWAWDGRDRWLRRDAAAERAYRALIGNCLAAPRRTGRNGGVYSMFGITLRFDLAEGYPLFTSRPIFFRGVIEELLWFLRGSTNAKELSARGVHIWDGNSSRAFLDSRGLTSYPEGELGPIYGAQWRNYSGAGIDQVANILTALRHREYDRRLVMTAWNPVDLDKMALPPCHLMAMFYLSEPTEYPQGPARLSCTVIMRSCDLFHGLPFNVACYAALVHILCHLAGGAEHSARIVPGELLMVLNDAHVYEPHAPHVARMLEWQATRAPQLAIRCPVDTPIEQLAYEDFELADYHHGAPIKAPMVA